MPGKHAAKEYKNHQHSNFMAAIGKCSVLILATAQNYFIDTKKSLVMSFFTLTTGHLGGKTLFFPCH
jgi:hypothetical protein